MKKTFIYASLALVVLSTGCKKEEGYKQGFESIGAEQARLKVIYASAYSANPLVQLSIDDVRVSHLITGRTPFPGGGYNTTGSNFPDYLNIQPGTRKFTVSIPKKGTNVDSVVFYTTQIEVKAGVQQTLQVTDTLTKTKSLVVVDSVQKPLPGLVRYRFVNLMPNVPKLDLYFGAVLIATNVEYNTAGFVIDMPVQTTQTWSIRETGTLPTSTALATYPSGSTVANQRVLTAFAMGYKGSTSATLKPYISFAINL